jgi:hypothetical protein
MSPARYACAGRLSERARRHFSLDLESFTQFSSPIRRYLDIVVHRMLLEVVARSSGAPSGTSGGSMPTSLTPDYVQQLCEASDKSAARARAVQNLTWDLCLAKHLSSTPRVLRAIVTQVSSCYIKIYVPQLPYLPDGLRRIPVRALCPSTVSCEDNETVLVLSWGTKERAVGSCNSSTTGEGGLGTAGAGGCWILGDTAGSVVRVGFDGAADAGGVRPACREPLPPPSVDLSFVLQEPPDGTVALGAAGAVGARQVVSRRIQLFDWVSVQLTGHVDARGMAGPKLEALLVGDLAIPFDHRANPLQRLVTNPPPTTATLGTSLLCAQSVDSEEASHSPARKPAQASPRGTATAAAANGSSEQGPGEADIQGRLRHLLRCMWSVLGYVPVFAPPRAS